MRIEKFALNLTKNRQNGIFKELNEHAFIKYGIYHFESSSLAKAGIYEISNFGIKCFSSQSQEISQSQI